MPAQPSLSQEAVRQWTGSSSFAQGQQYAEQKAILYARRVGTTLRAHCQGSHPKPYRVEATLGAEGVQAAACSCPVGVGGHCKHVAALLLTWLQAPHAFLEIESVEAALSRCSRDELAALASDMITRYPDLEFLLAQQATRRHEDTAAFVDPDDVRHQAVDAMSRSGAFDDRQPPAHIAADLAQILERGDALAEGQAWAAASVVYCTVAGVVMERYHTVPDEEGDVATVLALCAEKLCPCLASVDAADERQAILNTLFALYRWDVDFGAVGIGDGIPACLRRHATPEERRRVGQRIREQLKPHDADGWAVTWNNQVYGRFLLAIEADLLDDESYLQVCRETDRLLDLVERLLQMRRVEEAVAEAQRADAHVLPDVAEAFAAQGYADRVEAIVRERSAENADPRLAAWLQQWA